MRSWIDNVLGNPTSKNIPVSKKAATPAQPAAPAASTAAATPAQPAAPAASTAAATPAQPAAQPASSSSPSINDLKKVIKDKEEIFTVMTVRTPMRELFNTLNEEDQRSLFNRMPKEAKARAVLGDPDGAFIATQVVTQVVKSSPKVVVKNFGGELLTATMADDELRKAFVATVVKNAAWAKEFEDAIPDTSPQEKQGAIRSAIEAGDPSVKVFIDELFASKKGIKLVYDKINNS